MGIEGAERILTDGRIRISPGGPLAEALLVRGERIAAVGTVAEIRAVARRGAVEQRLDGAWVTAGLVDSHIHPTAWALARRAINLAGALSVEEAVEGVVDGAAGIPDAGWVRGHGWSRHPWTRAPKHGDLDGALPGRAIFLDSQDLHSAWLSGEALRRCGIDRDTADPPGGRIERDPATGDPTGILLENARSMALDRVPAPARSEIREALIEAQAELLRLGLTGIHSVEAKGLEDFEALHAEGTLRIRVVQAVQLDDLESAIGCGLRSGAGDEWLRIGGVKMFLDGSLGSRTAWLREPYLGSASDLGIPTLPADVFRAAVARASAAGLSSTVHAIGDAAVELALDVLTRIAPAPGMPHRIEHVQLCGPDLWARAGRSGIVGSMQPVHLLTDRSAAERHWGEPRNRGAYACGALARAGMLLAFGSDAPVETPDPRPGLYAAQARGSWADYAARREPESTWYLEHALSPADALAGYTTGPAAAVGESGRRGRLLPGYDADLVVWSRDPAAEAAAEIGEARCLLTMVGGKVLHQEIE